MRFNRYLSPVAACVLLCSGGIPAYCTSISLTSAQWAAATTNVTLINFSNFIDPSTGKPIASGATPTSTTSSGITMDGVQSSGSRTTALTTPKVNYGTATAFDDWGTGGPVLRGPDPDWVRAVTSRPCCHRA